MKWITRERIKVDRVACPWLIRKFVDDAAEFLFVPAEQVMKVAEREGATPYDVSGVELGHHNKECSFEAIVKKYNLTGDPALVLLGKIVNGADNDNTLWHQPEGPRLEAIAEGFRHWAMPTTRRSTPPNGSSTMRFTPTARRWFGRARSMGRSNLDWQVLAAR
jgi:hypothetical protein